MNRIFLAGTVLLLLFGCSQQPAPEIPAPEPQPEPGPAPQEPPEPLPEGVLVDEIPANADIIFSSVRYALDDPACLDENYGLKERFIHDPACNSLIYSEGGLGLPRQIFVMDSKTGEVTQVTNIDCDAVSGQVVDSHTLMLNALCSSDRPDLYLLDLRTEEMDCLTCDSGLENINNPDYSPVTRKILFSARLGPDLRYPNYLFTIDADKNLAQLTNDSGYMDFDCSWSEDGTKIVFSRVPIPVFEEPSEAWIADADGSGLQQVTQGGPNPDNEENFGPYTIGIDADPDPSPDNSQIAISRLRTGKENGGFGLFELIVVDVETGGVEVLDSNYANMIPEWGPGGILFLRQVYSAEAMEVEHNLYIYKDGEFTQLLDYPYNVFPLGPYSCSWIEVNQ